MVVSSCCLQEKPYAAICLEALKALQKFMETLLLSEENPKISIAAIQNFAVDVTRCESKCHTYRIAGKIRGFRG